MKRLLTLFSLALLFCACASLGEEVEEKPIEENAAQEENAESFYLAYHLDRAFRHMWFEMPIELTATSARAVYHFSPSDWSLEVVEWFVEIGEEVIEFIGDWLGYHHNAPFNVIFVAPPHTPFEGIMRTYGGGVLNSNTVFVFSDTVSAPTSLVHEIAHLVLGLHPNITLSNFENNSDQEGDLIFEEGLCDLLMYLFIAETTNETYALGRSLEIGFDGRASRNELIKHVHLVALEGLRSNFEYNLLARDNLADHIALGFDAPGSGYEIAASFLFYIYENSATREDFLKVYMDVSMMIEVFGVDIDEMIRRWIIFLEKLEE